jgi:hypothetical protein
LARLFDRAGNVLGRVSPWLSLPTAIVAFVGAFFNPIAGTVLGWFGCDGARLTVSMFAADFINVGSDDTRASERKDQIDIQERIVRGILDNRGFSVAGVDGNFTCNVNFKNGTRSKYLFKFYDPNNQTKAFPDVAARSSVPYFASVDSYVKEIPDKGPTECTISYSDKYGAPRFATMTVEPPLEQRLGGVVAHRSLSDAQSQRKDKYCFSMVRDVVLGPGLTADCVSSTHVVTVESADGWDRAISSALRTTNLFNDIVGASSAREPGIILVCNKKAGCKDFGGARTALAKFTPQISLWLCNREDDALEDCEQP